jgi:hypothetical protein
MKMCSVEDCDKRAVARGYCMFHYKRWRFGRTLEGPKRPAILLDKHHPVYIAWTNMKTRCDNPKSTQYKWYGGRGIRYTEDWFTFAGFYDDMYESWEPGLTLDRKDNNGPYCKDNCRWATHLEQGRNRNPKGYLDGEVPSA